MALAIEPVADCARYDQLRAVTLPTEEALLWSGMRSSKLMGQLKLAGMRAAYDEVVAAGVRAQHSEIQRIIGELLLAQLADNRARSTAYRLQVLPASR